MYNTLTIEYPTSYILVITLNRPQALNALNREMIEELAAAITNAQNDHSVMGIIIRGSGTKGFAAGADIAELASLDETTAHNLSKRGQEVFASIENSPKPIIAAVNGIALGGGCELAMACHMRIASDNAKFGQPEIKLGLIAGYGGTQRLVHLIGRGKATEMLLTGDLIDATEAHRLGLVNCVVSQADLMRKCYDILGQASNYGPIAIALTLEAISAGVNGGNGYEKEAQNFGKAMATEDAGEGISAFLQKRAPEFRGR